MIPGILCVILEGAYSQNGVVEAPRYSISELYFGKFPNDFSVLDSQLQNPARNLLEVNRPQHSSRIQRIWHYLLEDGDKVIQELLWNMEKERDERGSAIPIPRCARVPGPLYRAGGTYSQNRVMETQRCPISELHLCKFPVIFKTEVCADPPCPSWSDLHFDKFPDSSDFQR